MANTSTLNSELFQNLLTSSEFALYENSVARAVATLFDYPMGAGKRVQVPFWDSITSSKPGEGVAPDSIDTDTNNKFIDLEEHVAYAKITDVLRDSAASNVIGDLSTGMGLALAEGLDKELISLFANVGITQEVGAAGSDNTVNDLMKAAAYIRSNKYSGPLFAILNPKQAYGIKAALTATNSYQNATTAASRVMDNYFIGQVAGITVLEHALVGVDASDDAVGCVFAPAAFGIAQRGGVTMETQRIAKERATDVVLTVNAGAGLLRPGLAVRVIGDAAL